MSVMTVMPRSSCHVPLQPPVPLLPSCLRLACPVPAATLCLRSPSPLCARDLPARLRPVMAAPTFFCRMDALNKLVVQNGRYRPPRGVLSSILHKKFLRSVHSAIQMPGAGSLAQIDARASMPWTSKTPAPLPSWCLRIDPSRRRSAVPARRRGIDSTRRHRSVPAPRHRIDPARRRSIDPARCRRVGLPRRHRSAPWSDTPLSSAMIRQRFSVMPLAKRGVGSNMNNVHFEGEASRRRQVHEYRRHIAGGNPRGEP